LAPGGFHVSAQARQIDVVCHVNFVQQDQSLLVEGDLAVLEPPDEAGQGARLGDPGLRAQVAGRLARGGGAQHPMAGALEGLHHGPKHCGFARTGHAHHQFRPPSRGADA